MLVGWSSSEEAVSKKPIRQASLTLSLVVGSLTMETQVKINQIHSSQRKEQAGMSTLEFMLTL